MLPAGHFSPAIGQSPIAAIAKRLDAGKVSPSSCSVSRVEWLVARLLRPARGTAGRSLRLN
jgi:hypothetical protein